MKYPALLILLAVYSAARNGPEPAKGLHARDGPTDIGVPNLDGIPLSQIPRRPSVQQATAGAISQTGWTVTCDSFQTGYECAKAIDGNSSTFWQAATNGAFPHTITIDMKTSSLVGSITIQPRQDGNSNGNIGQHTISLRYALLRHWRPLAKLFPARMVSILALQ